MSPSAFLVAFLMTLAFIMGAVAGTFLFIVTLRLVNAYPTMILLWVAMNVYITCLASTYFVAIRSPVLLVAFLFGVGATQLAWLSADRPIPPIVVNPINGCALHG